ncbi:hypothetical protein JCM19294_1126 [Nonlabens tegetincola]|uniref:Uncharacterized protein n=1 Tax=Nonlabens tegetincola TaxID=323273 RepID=A0A090Q3N9_9FLAO|nr:hypothetical protein [Nonlabens tegetincola]GAK96817.1 hypothetical protein JCM19294_1126 [Nonlabens tegetincola]
MSKEQHYTLQEAMNVMKGLSKTGRSFDIVYMKINGGLGKFPRCRMIKQNLKNDKRGRYKLQFINDEDKRKSCYIPLLMSVNGIKIVMR